jgi:hypothetical protein
MVEVLVVRARVVPTGRGRIPRRETLYPLDGMVLPSRILAGLGGRGPAWKANQMPEPAPPPEVSGPVGKPLARFFLTPIIALAGILLVSGLLKAVSLGADQIVTLPAALASVIVIPVWAAKASPVARAGQKALILLLQAPVWGAATLAALETGILTAGIHQPGGALLLFLPPCGFIAGIVWVANMASKKAARERRERTR